MNTTQLRVAGLAEIKGAKVTTKNRGIVKKWLRSQGVKSVIVDKLTLADLTSLWKNPSPVDDLTSRPKKLKLSLVKTKPSLFSETTQKAIDHAKNLIKNESTFYNTALTSSSATKDYLITELAGEKFEVFAVIFLDNQHKILKFDKLFKGTIDAATVYPRVVAQKALENGASACILSHNHPSGIPEPSLADKQITQRLIKALGLLDIRILDHVIVAGHQTVSLAERGEM